MDILGKLFGSNARVKILRLFLLNPLDVFDVKMVAEKSKVRIIEARREISLIKSIGVICEKAFSKETETKDSKKITTKKHGQGYQLKSTFPFLVSLKGLIVSETPLNRDEIINRFKGVGKIKFLAISGIFLDHPDARVDVLVVGDNLNKRLIENVLRSIEAEIGKELSYGALETAEFLYRISIYDKFVRDILDFRHEKVIDKLNIV